MKRGNACDRARFSHPLTARWGDAAFQGALYYGQH